MELEKLKNALIASDAIFHNSHDGVVCINAESVIVFVNKAAHEMFGYEHEDDLLGRPVTCLMSPEHEVTHPVFVQRHLAGESSPVIDKLRRIRAIGKDGASFPVDIHVFQLEIDGDQVFASFIRDMSEIETKDQELHDLAFNDPLTGLPNMKSFEALLQKMYKGAAPDRHVIAVLGIDRMRNINGSFGFEIGDQVIQILASRIEIAFDDARFVGRVAGDQFVIVIDSSGDEGAMNCLTDLRRKVDDLTAIPIAAEGARVKVEITVGAIEIPTLAATPENAVKHVELAYGDAKKMARSRLHFITQERLEEIAYTAALTHQLQDAIQIGEFYIVIQPKVDVRTGQPTAGEVLVRWRRSDGQHIPPGLFIPVAEDTGLVDAIGRFVFLETCTLLRGTKGDITGYPKLAVNLSPKQLGDEDFVDFVADTFRKLSVDPRLFEFEITETAVASASGPIMEILQNLRKIGISIALDDFGTGYSSLTMLTGMPVDKVKLDKSFIDKVEDDVKSFKLVENSIRMMQDLDLTVTVEGVETRSVHDMLFAMGVDEAQGYFYSKPLLVEDFRNFRLDINNDQQDTFSRINADLVRKMPPGED
jgi:diguanylate cyclase (GGDEF)-like protein/PAS domain S-box-containing protein